ncbi:MAG: phosphoribosylamine--glycine ligase [Clostridiales bacterium]|nr:phosphoribosylamine--glycine ligase [Clostridiales bacterium]
MKVLVIGGGGREHALIQKLSESKEITSLYCAPGNGGIAALATCVPIKATDIDALADYAVNEKMDYVVVAPDDPLCLGLVDLLAERGIPAFGPSKAAARIEGSKIFSKDLMKKYQIPTAGYEAFDDMDKAIAYVKTVQCPVVVKADGLALGKGVIICENNAEAEAAVTEMMANGKFGKSGSRVVVEEFLTGPEVSVLCFCDGKTLKPMLSSMDHKRALDGDQGLNTGGMGVIAPNPYYTAEIAQTCMDTIFLPTLKAMQKEGCPFKGCLYFGLMLTPNGTKVIEYNCRFGDPETQAVLPLLRSDLFTIMRATTDGTLATTDVTFADGTSCCVVLASGGYPEAYETGKVINGLAEASELAHPYHAGTKLDDQGRIVTAGGRVLGVTATANTLPDAITLAYKASDLISFDGLHRRSDIGQLALKASTTTSKED